MRFYRAMLTDGVLDELGVKVLLVYHVDGTVVYVVCEGEGKSGWEEVTQEEYESIGGILPEQPPK